MLFSGLIDYNFLCFREAIQQVFELRNKTLFNNTSNPENSSSSALLNGKTSGAPELTNNTVGGTNIQ